MLHSIIEFKHKTIILDAATVQGQAPMVDVRNCGKWLQSILIQVLAQKVEVMVLIQLTLHWMASLCSFEESDSI